MIIFIQVFLNNYHVIILAQFFSGRLSRVRTILRLCTQMAKLPFRMLDCTLTNGYGLVSCPTDYHYRFFFSTELLATL